MAPSQLALQRHSIHCIEVFLVPLARATGGTPHLGLNCRAVTRVHTLLCRRLTNSCLAPRAARGHYGFVFQATNKVTGKSVAIKRVDRSLCTPYRIQEEVSDAAQAAAGHVAAPAFILLTTAGQVSHAALPATPCSLIVMLYLYIAGMQIEVLQRVGSHSGVISLLDAFETQSHVELVMELMEGGELYGRIATKGAFDEGTARVIARRLVDAIKFLHKNNIVHRDLKPENILIASLVDESDVKVRLVVVEVPLSAPRVAHGAEAFRPP
jgi:serine/threonine protein kinase